MSGRWKLDEGATMALGFLWVIVGFVGVVAVALATPRHSLAMKIAVVVWVAPILASVAAVLWSLAPEAFGARPRLGLPFRHERVERRGSEQLIETWRQKYILGEVEIDEFEDGVWRAMTGASDAATIARAQEIADSRPRPDEWFHLAHERRLQTFENADSVLKSLHSRE